MSIVNGKANMNIKSLVKLDRKPSANAIMPTASIKRPIVFIIRLFRFI